MVTLKYMSSRVYASVNKLTWQMGFTSNSNILLVLQKDLVYLNVHKMLYFCAIGRDWYYTDCNISASFRCFCHQMWYRRRPEPTPAMPKLAQIGPLNRGLHWGLHKQPPDTSKRSETKNVIRYQISKPTVTLRGIDMHNTATDGAREDTCI